MKSKRTPAMTRRGFLGSAATGAALFSFIPERVFGADGSVSANNKLNIAGVGVGGMGKSNLEKMESDNIVALCDVDWSYAGGVFSRYPNAKRFKDYRKMLDAMGREIDAVVIATPDHTHAVIAMECMRRGKHVYVQKPLTKTVYEARMLTEAARRYNVVTQMGNQGHSGEGIRTICEWIWDGAIGQVREVHSWTNRPVWPQGMNRPKETMPVPESLDWDLFIGPAPFRPYHSAYHPWDWRAWVDFGTGALGDMACHIMDPIFWALKLKYPISAQGSYAGNVVEKWRKIGVDETYPLGSVIHLEYPEREGMPAVKVHWYDGGLMPERPAELEGNRRMGDSDGGVLFVGDKGKLMCGCYGQRPELVPYSRMREYRRPEPTLPRISVSHEMNWVDACKGNGEPSAPFDYSGPFTEMVLMGNLCLFRPGEKIVWDGDKMEVTNIPELNRYVNPPYREGWTL
ncbi:MAG: Gfo/Idh/MocA family oxidoreductase [Phycisphaerae bacterium]|nr:Gfo/Idh/MocA family oxidoreductase [Phycisphaerae bacterium]